MKNVFPPEIYENNMVALKVRFPEIHARLMDHGEAASFSFRATQTPSGQANISVDYPGGNHVRFYEEDDIVGSLRQEMTVWDLGTGDFLFCVGMGLGYLPLLASQHYSGKPAIVVIEPNPEILRLALSANDLRPLLSYERLDLFLGLEPAVSDIIGKYGDRIFFGKNQLVSHGPSRLLYGDPFKSLENEVVDSIRVARNIGFTARHAGKKLFLNTIKNLPHLFSGPDLSSLEGRFKGCTAICIAAGPSLDKDLAHLKAVGHRALILCADSSVRSLVSEGIVPHVVVTSDMNPVNFEKLRTSLDALRESVLVYSIEANPDNVGAFLGPRRIAVTSQNALLNQWLGTKWDLDWQLPAMTSVSHTALFTAMRLGADPIILVGMDFAYKAGQSHAAGSVFRYPAQRADTAQVQGVHGYPVPSMPQLITDRKQLENTIATSTVRFIDTSLDGALIKGTENRSFQEVLETTLQNNLDVLHILEGIDWADSVPASSVAREFESMVERAYRFISACHSRADRCRDHRHIPGDRSDGERYVRLAEAVGSELPAFERENRLLFRLLKLVRYGDVKELSTQLAALQSHPGTKADRKADALKALSVYADYFTSLEGAARYFKSELMSVRPFFSAAFESRNRIDRDMRTADAHLDMANHYLAHGVLWKAESAFLQYLEKRPEDSDVWVKLGRMYCEKGLFVLAQRYARQMKARFPMDDNVKVLESNIARVIGDIRLLAVGLMDKGAFGEANPRLCEYLSLVNDDATAQILKLQKKMASKDRQKADEAIQLETIMESPEQREGLNQQARDCLDRGDTEEAVGVLEGLAQTDDQNGWQYIEKIGDIRLSQQDLPSALWNYQKALEQSPKSSALASKIQTLIQQSAKEIQSMDSIIANCADRRIEVKSILGTPEEIYRQARSKIEQGAYPEAVTVLEQLLSNTPDHGTAHNDLGVLYFNQGEEDQSFFHYKEAVRIEPENSVYQKNLADFYYVVKGDVRPALEIYVNLLSKDPKDRETLLILGQICKEQAQFDDAAVFYQRILEFDPTDADANRALIALAERRDPAAQDPMPGNTHETAAPPIEPDVEEMPTFPSPIVHAEINHNHLSYPVQIPEQEMFRITSIFEKNEYAVTDKRRRNGVFNVFDVGANVGLFAISVHNRHPHSRIYCFEPSPQAQMLLEANVGRLPEMVIHKYGLYNRDMETKMHIHQHNTGQNSIRFEGRHHHGDVDVQLKDAGAQFDALGLSHLDILKIDTEGCEVEILESLGGRIDRVDYVLVEYHTEKDRRAIDELLKQFHLLGSHSVMAGIGTVKYVHPSLVN